MIFSKSIAGIYDGSNGNSNPHRCFLFQWKITKSFEKNLMWKINLILEIENEGNTHKNFVEFKML